MTEQNKLNLNQLNLSMYFHFSRIGIYGKYRFCLCFQKQLEKNGLTDRVNVVHLSDHGMISVTPPYFINITQYMTNDTYEWAGASPCIQIIPHEGK